MRLKLTETPVFARAVERGERVKTPLAQVFRGSWRELIIGTFVMLATHTLFYIVTTRALSYELLLAPAGSGLGFNYIDFLRMQLIAVLFFAAMLPVVGWLADRRGRRAALLVVTAGIVAYGGLFGLLLSPAMHRRRRCCSLIIGMTLMGLSFGPMSAVLPELFPTNVRTPGRGGLQHGQHPRGGGGPSSRRGCRAASAWDGSAPTRPAPRC